MRFAVGPNRRTRHCSAAAGAPATTANRQPSFLPINKLTAHWRPRTPAQDVGGVLPALQRLSYAGKHLDDAQRTLEHYGVAYWAAKFPAWPIRIRKRERVPGGECACSCGRVGASEAVAWSAPAMRVRSAPPPPLASPTQTDAPGANVREADSSRAEPAALLHCRAAEPLWQGCVRGWGR